MSRTRRTCVVCLLLVLTVAVIGDEVLMLTETELSVVEGRSFSIPIKLTGRAEEEIQLVVRLASGDPADFVSSGTSRAHVFTAGTTVTSAVLQFFTRDDDVPEKDEEFVFELVIVKAPPDAVLDQNNNRMTVTILANDDAYGIFGFSTPSPVIVSEPVTSAEAVTLTVTRYRGTFSDVTIAYTVVRKEGSDPVSADIAPVRGTFMIYENQMSYSLQLLLMTDEIPEADETFIVDLSLQSNLPTINNSRIEIIIKSNDAPISFVESLYTVHESDSSNTVRIPVTRGLSGTQQVGPLERSASVDYRILARTATFELDFLGDNGTLRFQPGESRKEISMFIQPDDIPETAESFRVELTATDGDVVLKPPTAVEIRISANDDQHGVLNLVNEQIGVLLDEDNMPSFTGIRITRTGGTFGLVSVRWSMTSSEDGVFDVSPRAGLVTLESGLDGTAIELTLENDQSPEPARRYTIQLVPTSLTGGARLGASTNISFIVGDSDDMYGLFDFLQGEKNFVSQAEKRNIEATIVRRGGLTGHVLVNYTATYNYNNTESSDAFESSIGGQVLFLQGQSEQKLQLSIAPSTFLHVGATFVLTIHRAALQTAVPLGPFNSPRPGLSATLQVAITNDIANGFIGFSSQTPELLEEPEAVTRTFRLAVNREGTNGEATVSWILNKTSEGLDVSDVGPWSGTVLFTSGDSVVYIDLLIKPDAIPEVAETFDIVLTESVPSLMQRLKPGAERKQIVIAENDNPGGVFGFSAEMKSGYTMLEGGDPLFITVVRQGGALSERSVSYSIVPNGIEEFYGYTDILVFAPGETVKNATILTIADQVPEIDEMFILKLSSYGESNAVIGMRSTVNITVPKNDDPNGVFRFDPDKNQIFINESKGVLVHTADVTLLRTRGTFGLVTVEWTLTGDPQGHDLSPTSGRAEFLPGELTTSIEISSVADEIPETDERFNITLSNPTGGAAIGEPSWATVVVSKNDDGISFVAPATFDVREGSDVNLTVVRDGGAAEVSTVRFRTVDGNANASENDFVATQGTLVFDVGVTEQIIQLRISQDALPEPDEDFFVDLYDAQGDVVVFGSPRATVVIVSNDNAGGTFRFAPPSEKRVNEGQTQSFSVVRGGGTSGEVEVGYEIVDSNPVNPILNGTDFQSMSGTVRFQDGDKVQALVLEPRKDYTPEFDERFNIRLTQVRVTGGAVSQDQAVLSGTNLEVTLIVLENDDPYGVLGFPFLSRERAVAEDFNSGMEATTSTNFTVRRSMGTYGDVEAVWGVFSDAGANLPRMRDLLFLGDVPLVVKEVAEKTRPGTGTMVLSFDGSSESFVTVPADFHPSPGEINAGFTISVWLQPTPATDASIFAKVLTTGTVVYGLKLRTGNDLATFTFEYLGRGSTRTTSITLTAFNTNLEDGQWHNVIVLVGDLKVTIYVRGKSIGSGTLTGEIDDQDGTLYVGSEFEGIGIYTGLMQDLIFFSRELEEGEIQEIFNSPSRQDVRPLSGYVTFPDKTTNQNITLSSLDDLEEESTEFFSLVLISATGGARVSSTDNAGILKVMKSDNANGLFGFSGECSPKLAAIENETFVCPVLRSRGNADDVRVYWAVNLGPRSANQPATQDFVEQSGHVVFKAGTRNGNIEVIVKDDNQPELRETFTIILTAAVSADGDNGTTATSGASIQESASERTVAVEENDYPYGLFQFSNQTAPPSGSEIIQPGTAPATLSVSEESGLASVLVVRAQGVVGDVSIEWLTVDGTATSAGDTPDFQNGGGRLNYVPGQNYAYINITLYDDSKPEDNKYFDIRLLNPTRGAAVGYDVIRVTILNSDFAYGVFVFADESLETTTNEPLGTETVSVVLEVIREQGTLGSSTLTWQIDDDPGGDLLNQNGSITFIGGQQRAQIQIGVKAEDVPELTETFRVSLLTVTKGQLGSAPRTVATISVTANDDPYGVFVIPQTMRPARAPEEEEAFNVTVVRQAGSIGEVKVTYRIMAPSETYPFLPKVTRASEQDYTTTTGSVLFSPGQAMTSFPVEILADDIPEADESIFVLLESVEFVPQTGSEIVVESPRLGTESEVYGQVIISRNDNSSGVLVLSMDQVNVTEGESSLDLEIVREAGAFGEIAVTIEIVSGSAKDGLDYAITSSTIKFLQHERRKPVPVDIADDSIPETEETFTVRLLEPTTGGAVIGEPREAVVTILPSDDPFGAFVFAEVGMSVEEAKSARRRVSVTVNRLSGTLNVVAVKWTATLNGVVASEDIEPTDGTLFFPTGLQSVELVVEVLPDNVPEGDEAIVLTLTEASNGGRIGAQNRFTLTVLANDNPHGLVQFSQSAYTLIENETDTTQSILLERSGGTVGNLIIMYSVSSLPINKLATVVGRVPDDYFHPPVELSTVTDTPIGSSLLGNKIKHTTVEKAKEICVEKCLSSAACVGFQISLEDTTCYLYTKLDLSVIPEGNSSHYYRKNREMATDLYLQKALSDVDFSSYSETNMIFPDGAAQTELPITVIADDLPEVAEVLEVRLMYVALQDTLLNPENRPALGDSTIALVTIAKNDEANGVLRIYSNDPDVTRNGSSLVVLEQPQLAVELIVEREGGSLGTVSVQWEVVQTNSTAISGSDYSASGATLIYKAGETRKFVTIAILDDLLPENDEYLHVRIYNPIGGARLADNGSMEIIISANDHVGGVLSFRESARSAEEGSHVVLFVDRSLPALGNVTVEWLIQDKAGVNATNGFDEYTGFIEFLEGEVLANISVTIKKDETPELNEVYQVKLLNPVTEGIRASGGASLDPVKYMTTITVGGSDHPHGVVSFAPTSRIVQAQEVSELIVLEISVIRSFGSIGKIAVHYDVIQGNLTALTVDRQRAGLDDFMSGGGTVNMEDGQASVAMEIGILPDDIPEVDEVFVVKLVGTDLLEPTGTGFVPTLAEEGITAEVVIMANDGTKGVISFLPSQEFVSVSEDTLQLELTIIRDNGTFGEVSIFFYTKDLEAKADVDYSVENQDIIFLAGEKSKTVNITILNDTLPEPSQQFEAILASPKNGVLLGSPIKSTVTILSNDEAEGAIQFARNETVSLKEPTTTSSERSRADLVVERGPGRFGEIAVSYRIVHVNGSGTTITDLEPTNGVITMANQESSTTVAIRALIDTLSEVQEDYFIELYGPQGGVVLGEMYRRRIVIESNDSPFGLLQIFPRDSQESVISVEEETGPVPLTVVRSRGTRDRVHVTLTTESLPPRRAEGLLGPETVLSQHQKVASRQPTYWHSFTVGNGTYGVLLNRERLGNLQSPVGSDGSVRSLTDADGMDSIFFRWQGVFVPVQTLETHGALSATTFLHDDRVHLLVINAGAAGHYETNSRLYRVTEGGGVTVVQDLVTRNGQKAEVFVDSGKLYLILANYQDNNERTVISSDLYEWDTEADRFSSIPKRFLSTRGARDVISFRIDGATYIAVANHYDSETRTFEIDSLVYKFDGENAQFAIHQRLTTRGATSLVFYTVGVDQYLALANSRDDTNDLNQDVIIYRWDSPTLTFRVVQTIAAVSPRSVRVFRYVDRIYLTIATLDSNSSIHHWDVNTGKFDLNWRGQPASTLTLILINQGQNSLPFLGLANPESGSGELLMMSLLDKNSDFVPVNLLLTFEPGQQNLSVAVSLLQDDEPENIESFQAKLVNPTHGSELGDHGAVTVQIASNDDAFGIVQFTEESRSLIVEEMSGQTNNVRISLERVRGAHGQVQVLWDIVAEDGGQILANDVTPTSGQATFVPGSRSTFLEFQVPDDTLPELDRVLFVRLTSVSEPGSIQPGKGAEIGVFNQSRLTVQASDSPHGVVSWRPASVTVQEPSRDDLVTLTIVREQGTNGIIRIMYMTSRDHSKPARHQAVAGEDYIAKQDTVFMNNGVNTTTVTVTIKHDTYPEEDESFTVNITSVQLTTILAVGGVGPSIKPLDYAASVTVAENDFAGGIVQFNVAGTSNARVDTYEGYGLLRLPLNRTVGSFGSTRITWATIHRETNAADYSPQDGVIEMREGQTFATVNITIHDDAVPEGLETFEVHLLKVDEGTAVLGPQNKVTVGILKNDSPNGVFGFIQTTQYIREPETFASDVGDSVTFDVGRLHGNDGSVTVTWRLTDRARDDFLEPRSGSLLFLQGEQKKSLVLRTRYDGILEGNEEFTLSLVSADNNGDISPSNGDATVVVLADTGANGLISVEQRSRDVAVGEPSTSYDGEVKINITRGVGRFGKVRVTWQIIPRDEQEFVDLQGEVTFADGQDNQTITVKTKDDTIPELRKSYTLDITSASGGALISSATGAKSSKISVAASDYPHGLFQFNTPQEKTVSEDVQQVSVTLRRDAGVNGRVKVRYATVSDTAVAGDDFHAVSGTLTFNNGEQLKLISLEILQDTIPEGPEEFYLNITEIILEDPSDNDYTVVNGVQLDMAPAIGPLSLKKIIIDKNDNAEGILEFDSNAAIVTVLEESGFAQIPVIRRGGSYGEVSATYTALDGSATSRDFSLPNGTVILGNGITAAYINATIIDDAVREFGESFRVQLISAAGGAVLGARDIMTVTIRKSDFPNGEFRFAGALELTIPNPGEDRVLNFTMERNGGNLGKQTLQWRLMGFNERQRPLFETDDIYHDLKGTRRTDGLIEWSDGDNRAKSIRLTVQKHVSLPEIEKTFWLVMDDVIGFPATEGSGEISATAGVVRLRILKYGHPNGIVRFVDASLQPQYVLEPVNGAPPTTVDLGIYRTDGIIGELKVHWKIAGPTDANPDILPNSGQATIENQKRSGNIRVAIQPDDMPELQEEFMVVLTVVDGGAEIMQGMNTSKIIVRYNDDPHGVFAVFTQYQAIVVNLDMTRSARVNITRQMGHYGIVRVGFTLVYDQSSSVGSSSSSNSLTFEDGATSATMTIMLPNNLFMALNSTFTLSLSKAEYIGSEKLIEPRISLTEGSCQVIVGAAPANSLIGFSTDVYNVDEVTNEAVVRVARLGLYGNLQIRWAPGYPSGTSPLGYTDGTVLTSPYSVSLNNQQQVSTIIVKVRPNDGSAAEQFAIHLPEAPVNTIPGGAQLWSGHTRALLDVHGVVGFHQASRYVTVDENVGSLQLTVSRVYGSMGIIRFLYRTYSSASESSSATADSDYRAINEAWQTMDARQTTAVITVRILGDSLPEVNEHFYVNITRVELVPTGRAAVSPRVSSLYDVSRITIGKNNHPHGLVYIAPERTDVEEGASTRLTVYRVGGTAGYVSVTVRTLGRGSLFSSANGTVEPTADTNDFAALETRVNFDDGSSQPRHVTLHTLPDNFIEPDETLVVYISDPSGGVAILQGTTTDNYMLNAGGIVDEDDTRTRGEILSHRTGYLASPIRHGSTNTFHMILSRQNSSVVTIRRSGLYNGLIGFTTQAASIDEDDEARTRLRVVRTQSHYDVTIQWKAKFSLTSDEQQDMIMADPEQKSGSIVCPKGARECLIDIRVRKDELPERQTTFVVLLKNDTSDGAVIDPNAYYSVITVNSSDHPDGLIQFAERSRLVAVNASALSVELEVERLQGLETNVSLDYSTVQAGESSVLVVGMTVATASPNVDYQFQAGSLNFPPNEKLLRTIKVWLTPTVEGERQYPRVFYLDLFDVVGGASIGHGRAQVLIVNPQQKDVWSVLSEALAAPLDNSRMSSILAKLLTETRTSRRLDEDDIPVISSILDMIIAEAQKRVLPQNIRRDVLAVFCQLASPERTDAIVGEREFAAKMETFAFTLLKDLPCPSGTSMIEAGDCAHVRTQVAKWYPENINGHKYQGLDQDYFHLPNDLLQASTGVRKECKNIALLEYKSDTWFHQDNDENQFLNQKVFQFSVEGRPSSFVDNPVTFRVFTKDKRIAPRKAQCVYSTARQDVWDGSSDVCHVTNNLRLGLDNYVDCSCKHLSYYAVRSNIYDPNVIGYPIWFYIASFICMGGLLLAVLSHHLCSIYSMFSANLLIHFCFSIAAFQLCYIVNAFLSPDYLLVQFSGEDNYKCLIMGLFTHYFFLTQFTWLFAQALNYWKILVLNDEHTERKYALYLLIGWGLPILLVAIFYVTVYCLYRYVFEMPVDTIYGDVNYNGNICFIANPFSALAGVIAPCVLCMGVLAIVFIQAYQVTSQWQAYDDVYRGRYNIKEVKLLLLFFSLLIVAYIWGGLHMTFSHIWWLVLYCVFIILIGLMSFVFYACLRTPCLPCFKPQEENYSLSMNIDGTVAEEPAPYTSNPPSVVGSLHGSKASLLKEPSWDGQSLTFAPGSGLRRSSYLDNQIFSIYEPKPPLPADEERNERDFDDLIFALKSEGLTPSEVSQVSRSEHDFSVDGSYNFSVAEANQTLRRISIADTHL